MGNPEAVQGKLVADKGRDLPKKEASGFWLLSQV